MPLRKYSPFHWQDPRWLLICFPLLQISFSCFKISNKLNHAVRCLLPVASHSACFEDSPVLLWGISSSFLLLAEEFPIVWIYQNVSQCIFQVTCLCYVFIVVPRFDFSKKVTMDVHAHVFSFLLNQSVPRNGIAAKCKFSFSRNCQTVSYFEILVIWPPKNKS